MGLGAFEALHGLLYSEDDLEWRKVKAGAVPGHLQGNSPFFWRTTLELAELPQLSLHKARLQDQHTGLLLTVKSSQTKCF